MLAAGVQNGHDHQVRVGEEPFLDIGAGRGGERTKVPGLDKAPQVLGANTRQADDLFFRKDLLTRFDSDHVLASQY